MITLTSNRDRTGDLTRVKGFMITTTLRNSKMISPYLKSRLFWHYYWNFGLPSFVLSRFLFRGMVRKGIPTVCFYIFSTEQNSELFSLTLKDSEGNSESMLLFLYPRKGIPSCFLFRWSVLKGIPRVRFYFCSTERNSELFSLLRKGSERNSEVFCSVEQLEFRRKYPFVPSIPSSAELFFCRKFPTLSAPPVSVASSFSYLKNCFVLVLFLALLLFVCSTGIQHYHIVAHCK